MSCTSKSALILQEVLLYGPPGTGKTMLAKAVAHHTTAAFIRVVGSEFVQKYLGEGYVGWDSSRAPGLGASAAVNAIILLEIFLYPKRLVYLYLLIPIPAAFMGAALIGADLLRVKKGQSHASGSAPLGGALVAALVWARIRKGWI